MFEGERELNREAWSPRAPGKETLGILGPGVLGLSAAQWATRCGLNVRLLGRDEAHANGGLAELERRWNRQVNQGKLDEEGRLRLRARVEGADFSREAIQDLSAILEAVPEDRALKVSLLADLGRWALADMLCLTGTSGLPVGPMAQEAGLQGRLVGFHLFVPVGSMGVVELAIPEETSDRTRSQALALAAALKKRPVMVRDQPGFAAARMALAQGLEAIRLVEAGAASAEDLDALMTLGYGHPVGPLELSDRIGLDLRLAIAEGIHRTSADPTFRPPELLRAMVARGACGRRAGRGFYRWDAEGRRM